MRNLSIRKMNGLLKGKKTGFTLVELIIVIAIIAILAAIAIPKFGEMRDNANRKADLATGKNIATVVAAKLADGEAIATYDGQTATATLINVDGSLTPKVTGKTGFVIQVDAAGNITVEYNDAVPVYPEAVVPAT